MEAVSVDSEAQRDKVEDDSAPDDEKFVQLQQIVKRGDLSFAPSPMLNKYEHTITKEDLSLAIINKMKVRCPF